MNNKEIDAKRIRLGKMTYFDTEYNGSAISPIDTYVFMVDINGTYVNPFNVLEELPVYDRVPYTNTTLDGEDFGTKIVLAQGEVQDGLCVVLERIDFADSLGAEKVSLNDLEKYMMRTSRFFIDRLDLIENNKAYKKGHYRKLIESDKEKLTRFEKFIESCERYKKPQYTK